MNRNTKAKKRLVSTYANGKPRNRYSGPWEITCSGYSRGVVIFCNVNSEQVQGRASFGLSLPTPDHCIGMANWLMQAAEYLKKEPRSRCAKASRLTKKRLGMTT